MPQPMPIVPPEMIVVVPLRNLSITEAGYSFEVMGARFEKYEAIDKALTDDSLIGFGGLMMRQVESSPSMMTKFRDVQSVGEVAPRLTQYNVNLDGFFHCLWFIKDNAVYMDTMMAQYPTWVQLDTRQLFNSNSIGEYTSESFTLEELNKAKDIYNKLPLSRLNRSTSTKPPEPLAKKGELLAVSSVPSHYNYSNYQTETRFDKAFNYLVLARSSSHLPLKISMLMGIYESLFNMGPVQVTKQLMVRASAYFDGSETEKKEVKKLIDLAYDVRSSFIHGSKPPDKIKDRTDLLAYCKKLDGITRSLMNKIIDKNPDLFLLPDEHLLEWFNKNLDGDNLKPPVKCAVCGK